MSFRLHEKEQVWDILRGGTGDACHSYIVESPTLVFFFSATLLEVIIENPIGTETSCSEKLLSKFIKNNKICFFSFFF